MKKLALFLALCLLVSSIGLTAFATDDAPIADTPAVDTPAVDTPAADAPAADAPAADAPAADAPAADALAADAPAADAPAADAPAADTPAADAPAADTPAADAPAADAPAADAPAADAPAADAPAADAPAADAPAADAPAADDADDAKTDDAKIDDVKTDDANTDSDADDETVDEEIVDEDKNDELMGGASDGTFIINEDGWIVGFEKNTPTIVFPQSVKGINVVGLSQTAFAGDTLIESVTIPANVTLDLSAGAFKNCTNLKSVSIANNTVFIPAECFMGCLKLEALTLPEALDTIGNNAFNGCAALQGLALTTNLVSIGNSAFANCGALKHVVFPASLKSIGVSAFANCSTLQEILIPDGVTQIGGYAFQNCNQATTLHLPTSTTKILNNTFSGCRLVKEIAIPNGVTEIGQEAFSDCVSAMMIRIPGTVKTIGSNAFAGRPANGWMRYDDCPADAYLAADALGTAGFLLAPVNGPCHEYAKTHPGIRFCTTLTRNYVERCYNLILNRPSEEAGLLGWCTEILNGMPAAMVVKRFTDSVEFVNRKLTPSEIIEIMYNTMLDRPSDPIGKADWMTRFDNGMTKDAVINGFSGSQEFLGVCANYMMTPGWIQLTYFRDMNENITAFVARCYTECLQRPWDPIGIEGWCQALITRRVTAAQVAHGFIFSDEFIAKKFNNAQFLDRLYHTYFDRDGDPAGTAAWLAQLNSGVSREVVNNGFLGSQEWFNLLARFGLKQ